MPPSTATTPGSTPRCRLLDSVRTNRPLLVEIAQALIRCPSPNPPGDVTDVANVAASLLRDVILPSPSSTSTAAIYTSGVEIHVPAPGIANVVAYLRSSSPVATPAGEDTATAHPSKPRCRRRRRRLVFSGHLDTYPTGDKKAWSSSPSPFSGLVTSDADDDGQEEGKSKEKRLYGRGAADMKGGIAASLVAIKAMFDLLEQQQSGEGKPPGWQGEILIALAGDEETMGTLGSGYLLEKNIGGVAEADAMVCGDAGSPAVVRIGEKGLVWLDVEAVGRAAHGAHVHKGVNAIERVMEAVGRVKGLEGIREGKKMVDEEEEAEKVMDEAKGVSERLSGPGEDDTLRRITVNVGRIEGGTSPNLVPDGARAEMDVRLPLGVSTDWFVQQVGRVLDPLTLPGVTFNIRRRYDPSWTSPGEEIVRCALKASREVLGGSDDDVVANMRVGASDSRLFRAKGIPTVVLGLTPHNMGAADEYLLVDELYALAEIHALIAFDFLKASHD